MIYLELTILVRTLMLKAQRRRESDAILQNIERGIPRERIEICSVVCALTIDEFVQKTVDSVNKV